MDAITKSVKDMYAQFPYPSPQGSRQKYFELLNLLKFFSIEAQYSLDGKTVLDAGTGTGSRLIEAAAALRKTHFVAVDVSEVSLAIAKQAAAERGIRNIEFRLLDLTEDEIGPERFDIVLSMGVIHHLSDPQRGLRNLATNLGPEGIVFLYLYGRHGGQERMRRKQIVSLLLGDDSRNFEKGIALVKGLGFDTFEYGWIQNVDDETTRNAMIVDAYLHVNEKLFDAADIIDLLKGSGLDNLLIYGVTCGSTGGLFESRLDTFGNSKLPVTQIAQYFTVPAVREAYEALPLSDKYQVLDLLLKPNGYTVMGFQNQSFVNLHSDSRIKQNSLQLGCKNVVNGRVDHRKG